MSDTLLAPGERGTVQTVREIRRLIREGRRSPVVREAAERVLESAGTNERDTAGEVNALFEFVRGHLRFTRDPLDVEQLTPAEDLLLRHRYADCDEYVTLLAALLGSVGIPSRLKVVRSGTRGPWQHIYLEVRIRDRWVPADATHRTQPLGWEVPHGSSMVFSIESGEDVGFIDAAIGVAASLLGSKLSDKDAKKKAKKEAKAKKKAEQLERQRMNALMQRFGRAVPASVSRSLAPFPSSTSGPAGDGSTPSTIASAWLLPAAVIGGSVLLASLIGRR